MIELFEGLGHLRLCYGKSRLEPEEKSGLTVSVECVAVKGLQSQLR